MQFDIIITNKYQECVGLKVAFNVSSQVTVAWLPPSTDDDDDDGSVCGSQSIFVRFLRIGAKALL